jgi:hypothetical protein
MSTRLGQKISRKTQNLGSKIQSKARMIGSKSNQALRMGDVALRRTSNTLKNVVGPSAGIIGSTIGQPEIGALAYGATMGVSKGIDNLRSELKPAKQVADRLEKLNLRKELQSAAENVANKLNEQSDFV